MTIPALTVRARARTFPLDRMFDARRRGVLVGPARTATATS
jgi:hypothetical protein